MHILLFLYSVYKGCVCEMNKKMLFSDIDDCCVCPFEMDNARKFGSEYKCNGDPNRSPPCEWMDIYGNMTLQEVVDTINNRIYAAEAQAEKEWLAKKAKEDKNKELAKKREQTRLANYSLNKEITRLRKVIRDRESAIQSLSSLHSAFGFANALMEGKDPNNISNNHPQVEVWKEANIRDNERLKLLLKEREQKNKERHNKGK